MLSKGLKGGDLVGAGFYDVVGVGDEYKVVAGKQLARLVQEQERLFTAWYDESGAAVGTCIYEVRDVVFER